MLKTVFSFYGRGFSVTLLPRRFCQKREYESVAYAGTQKFMLSFRRYRSSSTLGLYTKPSKKRVLTDFARCWERVRHFSLSVILAFPFNTIQAQPSSSEHQAHHPEQSSPFTQEATVASDSEKNNEMGGAMDEMMRRMGVPPAKELYPSLMVLSELTPEKRIEVESAARQRMLSGTVLMTKGLNDLANSVPNNDYEVMQQAVALLHEGMARFQSGLAAHQALLGSNDPQRVALDWFRREMSLPALTPPARNRGILGVTWFHFWLMLSSAALIAGFLWMYWAKMRRASELLSNLIPGEEGRDQQSIVQKFPAPSDAQLLRPTRSKAAATVWSGQLRVGRIFQETGDVKTFRLVNPAGGTLPFDYLPGQFITVTVPNGESTARRSYTIASSPTQRDYIEITVKHAPDGVVSGYLHTNVSEGGLLHLSGPAGAFVFTGRECKCIVLIAGGVGITPLMSVIRYLLDRSWTGEIFLVYGSRAPEDIIFREELDYLARRHINLHVVITVMQSEGTNWSGPQGIISKELLAKSIPDLPSRYIHICGPVPMMEATKQILSELGIAKDRIKTEAFGPALGKQERSPSTERKDASNRSDATGAGLPMVTFTDSDKAGPLPADKVVLEVAEELGVDIDYSCRAGVCGVCRVELLVGKVHMDVEDGLEPGDKEKNLVLACQARATCDISVKA